MTDLKHKKLYEVDCNTLRLYLKSIEVGAKLTIESSNIVM